MNSFFRSITACLCHGLFKNNRDRLNEEALEETYNFKTFFGDFTKITSRDGVVTLVGRVASPYEKELATRTATSVPFVCGVKNKLTIVKSASMVSDEVFAMKCHKRLAVMSALNMRTVVLTARGRDLRLEGMVGNLAAKNLIELQLRMIDEVESVDNQIRSRADDQEMATVRDRIDDVSITGLIKLGLLQDSMTKTLSISITTLDGNVTIHGQAVIGRQIQKVSEIALLFVGVRAVSNEMTIRRKASGG